MLEDAKHGCASSCVHDLMRRDQQTSLTTVGHLHANYHSQNYGAMLPLAMARLAGSNLVSASPCIMSAGS